MLYCIFFLRFLYYLNILADMQNRNNMPNNSRQPTNRTNQNTNNIIDRTTYNASTTKQNNGEKQSLDVPKMIAKIMQAILKFQNPTNLQGISRDMLKQGGHKIFFDVLCIFLRALDGHFERSTLNTQAVLFIISAFGYKGNAGKSIFQPLGAPHTWHNCIAILQWFSELANYSYSFEAGIQDKAFEVDQNSLSLNAFTSKNMQLVVTYISKQISHLEDVISNFSYSIETKQMAIRNQHAKQKDLSQADKQLLRQKQQLYRIQQQCIQFGLRVRECQNKIEQKKQKHNYVLDEQHLIKQDLSKLRYEIQNQALHPQQCERIKLQIRDIKNKIFEINDNSSQKIEEQHKINTGYTESFIDKFSLIRKFSQKLKLSPLYADSDMKPQIPVLSQNEFYQLIKKTTGTLQFGIQHQTSLQSIFKQRQFKQYFKKQDEFKNKIQARFLRQEKQFISQDTQIQSLQSQQNNYKQGIQRLKRSKEEKNKKNIKNQQIRKSIQNEIYKLQEQIKDINSNLEQNYEKKNNITNSVKQVLNKLKLCQEIIQQEQTSRNGYLNQAKKNLHQIKLAMIEKINAYKSSLVEIFGNIDQIHHPN